MTDAELEEKRETLRMQYVDWGDDIGAADKLYNELHRYDEEMTRRANESYQRESPDTTIPHREHGWYMPNDN